MDGRRRGPRVPSPILAGEVRTPRGGFSGIRRARVALSVMRKSVRLRVMKHVKNSGVPVVAYEHTLDASELFSSEATHDPEPFKVGCDVIVVNRWGNEFADVRG